MLILKILPTTANWIEFIGGPFDGYRQPAQSTKRQLASDIVWLVTKEALGQLNRRRRMSSRGGVLTSVALYTLDDSSESQRYLYAGSIGPRTFSDAIDRLN